MPDEIDKPINGDETENQPEPDVPEIPEEVIPVSDSILNSVKKLLGIEPSFDSFDVDIIVNINSAIGTLTQIGIGPETGFFIVGYKETYKDFLGDLEPMYQQVKMYLYLKTKLGFDPPSSSFVLESVNKQIEELEWRMKISKES